MQSEEEGRLPKEDDEEEAEEAGGELFTHALFGRVPHTDSLNWPESHKASEAVKKKVHFPKCKKRF